jgi:uncharacterized protein DUF998
MNTKIRWLALGGIVGPVLFNAVVVVEEILQRSFLLSIGYDPLKTSFASANALGPYGWMQTTNFIVIGLLIVGFAFGLHRGVGAGRGSIAGPLCIGLFGAGAILAGLGATDLPIQSKPHTLHGWVHVLGFLIGTLGLISGYFLMALRFRTDPSWRGYDVFSIAIGVAFVLLLIGSIVNNVFFQYAPDAVRIVWFVVIGVRLWTVVPIRPATATTIA